MWSWLVFLSIKGGYRYDKVYRSLQMTYIGFSTADTHAANNGSSENQNDGESSGDHNGNDAAFYDLDVAALWHYGEK